MFARSSLPDRGTVYWRLPTAD